ncbi:hypothetical protein JZ751_003941 [Albula glossodonta]|uniref:Uncharacterized protein n=1 Tax=Albula glossodonta TaxID=121402 RepID=A0A8T2P5W9_9TELE|nr:hypothetical protein JZ751_003941 [Albula glossodonta]
MWRRDMSAYTSFLIMEKHGSKRQSVFCGGWQHCQDTTFQSWSCNKTVCAGKVGQQMLDCSGTNPKIRSRDTQMIKVKSSMGNKKRHYRPGGGSISILTIPSGSLPRPANN